MHSALTVGARAERFAARCCFRAFGCLLLANGGFQVHALGLGAAATDFVQAPAFGLTFGPGPCGCAGEALFFWCSHDMQNWFVLG